MNSCEQCDQQLDFTRGKTRFQPRLMLQYGGFGVFQNPLAVRVEEKSLPPPIRCRCVAPEVPAGLEPIDDAHRGGPVHLQASGEIGLRDAGMIVDQPQYPCLLLGKAECAERHREVTVDRTVREPNVETQIVVEPADIVGRLLLLDSPDTRLGHISRP